jgi:phenylacetate-CoA ligase
VEFDQPYATFTGLPAVPLEQNQPPFWRTNKSMRQTIFTMHHIVAAKVEAFVERLNEGGFDYYSGYPSILYFLASLIEENGYDIQAPPKMIFTGAENLFENQRHTMARVFKTRVTDEYGFAEGCGNASRCEADVFHEDFEFGILECVDAQPIGSDQNQGQIVATGFGSYAMPLIRYEVGDVGTWSKSTCSCGRESKVLTQIDGRAEDYVVTPEGRKILRFDYIFKDTANVRNAQVVQKELGGIDLRIVRRPTYSQTDEELLKKEIRNRISSTLSVNFEYVNEIEREANGKIRAVRSLVRNEMDQTAASLSSEQGRQG